MHLFYTLGKKMITKNVKEKTQQQKLNVKIYFAEANRPHANL